MNGIIQKDLKLVKKAFASRALLLDFIGKGWLRSFVRLLLRRAMETRAEAASRQCPAPVSATELLWANNAVDEVMAIVAQYM